MNTTHSPLTSAAEAPPAVSLRQATAFWWKMGWISFGGPAGQIAILHEELVQRRRWISEQRFLHALNYCMLLPGPEAQQLATYIGWLLHRTWGGIIAGALFVLPSLFILIGLSWLYVSFGHLPWLAGILYGVKPAVAAIVVQAAHRIGTRALRDRWLWALAALSFVAAHWGGVPFPLIVGIAALCGYLGGRIAPQRFQGGAGHGGHRGQQPHLPALIDDHTPPPPHARFSSAHVLRILACGLLLWVLPWGLLQWAGGLQPLPDMAWFFTKAALLTFGGAYAVLPYVYQGAVLHYGWLSAPQMMDGLALGESTPGPLIMIVAFVGFLGGHGFAPFGPEHRVLAGVMAATLVTWYTFLPSFLFILAGGPLVESTHRQLAFTAPLTAITAAVVGVIVNLAVFFAGHVLWPQGSQAGVDWLAAALALSAGVALFHYKRSVMQVLAASALLGLLFSVWH